MDATKRYFRGSPPRMYPAPRSPLPGAVPVLPPPVANPMFWQPGPQRASPYGPGGLFQQMSSREALRTEEQEFYESMPPVPLVGLSSPNSRVTFADRPIRIGLTPPRTPEGTSEATPQVAPLLMPEVTPKKTAGAALRQPSRRPHNETPKLSRDISKQAQRAFVNALQKSPAYHGTDQKWRHPRKQPVPAIRSSLKRLPSDFSRAVPENPLAPGAATRTEDALAWSHAARHPGTGAYLTDQAYPTAEGYQTAEYYANSASHSASPPYEQSGAANVVTNPYPAFAPNAGTASRPVPAFHQDGSTPAGAPTPPRPRGRKAESVSTIKSTEDCSNDSNEIDESHKSARVLASLGAAADLTTKQLWLVIAVTVLVGTFVGLVIQQSFHLTQSLGTQQPSDEGQRQVIAARRTEEPYPEPDTENILGILANVSSLPPECGTDACLWQANVVASKVDTTLDPCQDFYSYVCTKARLQAKSLGERPFKASQTGLLIKRVASLLTRRRMSPNTGQSKGFLDQSTSFLRSCLSLKPEKETVRWASIRHLLRSLGLGGWPFRGQPTSSLEPILVRLGKILGLFPIVDVSLKKRLESEGYLPQLDKPQLTLLRLVQLRPEAGLHELRTAVRVAISLWKKIPEVGKLSQDVAHFEEDLANTGGRGRSGDNAIRVADLPRVVGLSWAAYLHGLLPEANETLVASSKYLDRLAEVLPSTSSRTLFNYLGYRIVVFLSPLLPPGRQCCSLLIPLSYDSHVARLSSRLQGCVHLLERLFPYGIIKLARLTFGASVEQQESLTTGLATFANQVRAAVVETASRARWLDDAEAAAAVRRVETMKIDLPGGNGSADVLASYYPRTTARFGASSLIRDYAGSLNATLTRYWKSRNDADWDARHHISCFSTGFEYSAGRNALYITLGSVAVLDSAGGPTVSPVLVPLLTPLIARAMFNAIDPRRPPIGRRWSSDALNRFRTLEQCLFELYRTPLGRYSWTVRPPAFVDDMIGVQAALAPSMRAYVRALSSPRSLQYAIRLPGSNVTTERLFFLGLAAAECEDVDAEAALARRKIELTLGLPAPLRVNVPLAHSPDFARVYACPKGSPMAKADNRCAFW